MISLKVQYNYIWHLSIYAHDTNLPWYKHKLTPLNHDVLCPTYPLFLTPHHHPLPFTKPPFSEIRRREETQNHNFPFGGHLASQWSDQHCLWKQKVKACFSSLIVLRHGFLLLLPLTIATFLLQPQHSMRSSSQPQPSFRSFLSQPQPSFLSQLQLRWRCLALKVFNRA